MYEIRFLGLGGQGVVSAADLLGKAAVKQGKWAHSFPFFGTAIRGGVVKAFTRIDDQPISIKSFIYDPDIIVIFDHTLLNHPEATEGLQRHGFILLNSNHSPRDIGARLGLKVCSVDATEIALRLLQRPIPSTVLLGALNRVTGIVPLSLIEEVIGEEFPARVADLNVQAMRAGYESVRGEL